MIYDVDYFINKFEAIPEDKWCTGTDTIGDRHCAQGHCGLLTSECRALDKIFRSQGYQTWSVNDGAYSFLSFLSTPKKRILKVLNKIKNRLPKEKLNSEQKPEECDATEDHSSNAAGTTKTIIKYVSVPETIKEQSKELILS